MVDLSKVEPDVLDAVRSRGWSDAAIRDMSADEAFDQYCLWHGLIGWGSRLRSALDGLRASEGKNENDRDRRKDG